MIRNFPKQGLGLAQTTTPLPKSRGAAKAGLNGCIDPCLTCGLHAKVRTPKMGITGQGRLGILYLGECQGQNEDIQGRQFVGDAGQVLRQNLAQLGLDFERDFFALNSVRCRTFKVGPKGESNRTPTDNEIVWCWKGTWNLIKTLKPKAIWLAGGVAVQSYLSDKDQDKPTMVRWRGWAIPDQALHCWVIPQYHPSFLQRSPKNKGLARLFLSDLRAALERSQQPFPVYEPEKHIQILNQEGDAIDLLRRALDEKPDFLEEDFETTGLKPHRPGHDIKYAAVCWGGESYAFRTQNPEVRRLLLEINIHPDIGLGAHNIQFEDLWCRFILGKQPQNWVWDSEVAAHVLDDRSGIISLEFQAAVRYSDWFFKNDTSPYLKPPNTIIENGKSRKTGANDINRIDQCPPELILKRVAKDALYGYWLARDQMQEIQVLPKPMPNRGKPVIDGYWLFQDSTLALGDALTDGGIIYNVPYFEEQHRILTDEITRLKADILRTPPAIEWKKQKGKDINPGSDDQVRDLLFHIYKLPSLGQTLSGDKEDVSNKTLLHYSTHQDVGAFCRLTIEHNKRSKLLGTYIEGYAREAVNHPDLPPDRKVIYPFIGVAIPRSYRSSSRNPNLQNIPQRDAYSKKAVRDGLLPWPGHRFLSADYGSHEFVIAANYSRDPEMIRYIQSGGDPHGDQAQRIFLLTKEQMIKDLRQITKGGWVFAMQYGSSAAWEDKQGNINGCAPFLWEESAPLKLADGTPIHVHLASKGIRSFKDFCDHCRAEEVIYWNKFAGLKAWQQEWLARYEREGQVPMIHGFRRQGLLTRNEIYNTSIQGTGYHFIQESYNELNKIRKEEGWKSKLIGEIHDENVASAHPDEFDYLTRLIVWAMRDLMQERYNDFLVVGLKVELKATDVDQPWSTQKDYP